MQTIIAIIVIQNTIGWIIHTFISKPLWKLAKSFMWIFLRELPHESFMRILKFSRNNYPRRYHLET